MTATKRRPRALISCTSLDYDNIGPALACLGGNLIANVTARLDQAGIDPVRADNLFLTSSPETALADADMLVVMGGDDVHPALYGQRRHELTATSPDELGDKFEIALVQHAVASGKKVFGICRGMQVMNVALEGSLFQNLEPIGVHSHAVDKYTFIDHAVRLTSGSRLASIFSNTEIGVRSAHHQAVDRIGKDLAVTARADDGTIEAIELQGDNLVLGVQWHPEEEDADRRQLEAIFSLFAARLRAA